MTTILIIIHVLVAVALILTVLLQTGKGASIGAAFGGGSSSAMFGARGPAGFMSKLTAAAAIIFMFTSLGLSLFRSERAVGNSVMDSSAPAQSQPASPPVSLPAPVTGNSPAPAESSTAAPSAPAQPSVPAGSGQASPDSK